MRKSISKITFFLILSILISIQATTKLDKKDQPIPSQTLLNRQSLSSSPLLFIENKGQVNGCVEYSLKMPNANIYFASDEIVYQFFYKKNKRKIQKRRLFRREKDSTEENRLDNIRVRFLGANESVKVEGLEESGAKVSYFLGNDPHKWVNEARAYHNILYRELYPHIDLVVDGSKGRIKHEYRVRAGGNVDEIGLRYEGAKEIRINEKGQLEIEIEAGLLKEDVPLSYQVIDSHRIEVETKYVLDIDNTIRFNLGKYRKDRELIIDPDLIFSTYLGGSHDENGIGTTIDRDGNVYVTGWTWSSDFPTTAEVYDTNYNGDFDIFITKLNSTGTDLLYSTYIGGSGGDAGYGIAIDRAGNAYVTGWTWSSDFPTTSNIYDMDINGDRDAFITKLNSTGTGLIYSTYLGGNDTDEGAKITIDEDGRAFVAGWTLSEDFPTTSGAFDASYNGNQDIFITKLNPQGTALNYSTYIGGSGRDYLGGKYRVEKKWEGGGIALDADGNAYVTGYTESSDFPATSNAYDTSYNGDHDVFITKLNSSGTDLLYSTFIGSSESDIGMGIAVDSDGNAYITGPTRSSDFPTTTDAYDTSFNGDQDVFITKIDTSGTSLLYSTYIGASHQDYSEEIAVDGDGNAYVTGWTWSSDFPTSSNAYDSSHNGVNDLFLIKLNPTGTDLYYSTYIGGSDAENGWGIAVDGDGNAYVTGWTLSSDFPTTSGAFDTIYNGQHEVFIIKIQVQEGIVPEESYTLTIQTSAGGTTDPSPGDYTYDKGTEVSVKATPSSGYNFSYWSGDASGSTNPITIVMDSNKSIKANFISTETPEIDWGDGGGGSSLCFIATATYGCSSHPHVKVLRNFRDKYLMSNKPGRLLVNLYYKYSPSLAKLIEKHKALKISVRYNLLPLVGFSCSIHYLGPIITGVMGAFICMFPIFLVLFYRRRTRSSKMEKHSRK